MRAYERLIRYAKVSTASAEGAECSPTTRRQFDLAQMLAAELVSLGVEDAQVSDACYVYGHVAATPGCEDAPTLGFIAHMDTSPDFSGENVQPRLIENYDGGDVELGHGRTLSAKSFPHLPSLKGRTLITASGDTLLGADDKAGIAEIVQAMIYLKEHPEIKHGNIRIAFNPDEEIGLGAHLFDVKRFGCDWAYTMDGGEVGEIEYENFNAASAKLQIKGVSVHPGYAKNKMVNAARIAAEFVSQIPADQTPETTQDYEGFYHLTGMEGNVERATVSYIIRDHDRKKFEARKEFISKLAATLNEKYGAGTVTAEINDQYYNMREKIEPVLHIIDIVIKAMEETGVSPKVRAIRGGTDGAQLSFKGLPCPNIFAGGINFHGPYEFVPVQSMEKAMRVIVKICELSAQYHD